MKLNRQSLLRRPGRRDPGCGAVGCAPLIVGGAAVGAMVAIDRRTSGAQIEDEAIELRAASRVREALGDRAHVNITSYNRQVLLTGEVPNEAGQAAAEQVGRARGQRARASSTSWPSGRRDAAQRSYDTLHHRQGQGLAGRCQGPLVGAFKVVTERGTVYLMGRVTQREADRATQIARGVAGVQRVVRMFEILSDEELRDCRRSG